MWTFQPSTLGLSLASTVALCGVLALACEPKLQIGNWSCPYNWEVDDGAAGADSGAPEREQPNPAALVDLPWSTSFEYGFCDYARVAGFCYSDPDAEYSIVTSPVHTGKFAAAFRVRGDGDESGHQARCVRQGVFPREAYYSAWYFIPEVATNIGLWNLFHFQGARGPGRTELAGIWDVSISGQGDGELRLFMFSFLDGPAPNADASPLVPIGEWFQIEVLFRRAADATGELAMYQNQERIFHATDLVTDDTEWGQWYVGNLANALMPPDSTVYVDDVMIRATE